MLRSTCPGPQLGVLHRSFKLFLVRNKDESSEMHKDDDHSDTLSTTDSHSSHDSQDSQDSQDSKDSQDTLSITTQDTDQFPEEPTTCCMSGCANCVWLDYVDQMSKYFNDGGESAIKEIEEKIQDPNMKAFLLSELRMREKFKK